MRKGFSKYRAKKTTYNGVSYASKAEALFAQHLDLMRKAKDPADRVVRVVLQPGYLLFPDPQKIVYIADFLVEYADGRTVVYDVKGMKTPAFALKYKIMVHLYPEVDLQVVKVSPTKGGISIKDAMVRKPRRKKKNAA